MTNWSVSNFTGGLKVFRFKIVKCNTRAFNRKFEIKPIPILLNFNANNHFWYFRPFFASDLMHNSTGYIIKQLVHAFSCVPSYGALGKFGEHSRSQLLRPIYTVRLCRIRQAYHRPATWIVSCKSNLQLAYDCLVGPTSCCRPYVSLLYATKSYRVNRPLRFFRAL